MYLLQNKFRPQHDTQINTVVLLNSKSQVKHIVTLISGRPGILHLGTFNGPKNRPFIV